MKFYMISVLLNNDSYVRYKENRFNNNNDIYNNLYNDYFFRKYKKENMKNDMLYNESERYTFSPLINKSGYVTFAPNNLNNLGGYKPYYPKYESYMKKGPYQNYSNFADKYPLDRRNTYTETNLYSNNFDKFNNLYNRNNHTQDHINNSTLNDYIKNTFRNNKINRLNKTDYGFYNPKKKHKNITLNNFDNINSKISEYLNNFNNNNRRINNNRKSSNKYDNNKNNNESIYTSYFRKSNKMDNFYNNKSNNKNNKRLNYSTNPKNTDNNSTKNNINNYFNRDDKSNKKIFSKSKEYFYTFNKENKNKNKNQANKNMNMNMSQKNSNISLNPSSLGVDQLKTYYTNKPNNINIGNGLTSNVNSASERMMDTQYHFLNGLKMASGEVNEYFYDFNTKKSKLDKNDDILSLQSLNDSKMMELANRYLSEEEDSTEKYQMNNIIYSKKKYTNK